MNLRTPNDFGALIRSRRRELKLDQATLAKQVGVSRLWVNEVEQGKARAEIGLVLRTLRVLGVELRMDEPAPPAVIAADIDAVVARSRKKDA